MERTTMRYVFIAVIFLILSQIIPAQNKEQLNQKVRGVVTDEASGQPLPYVTLTLDNTQTGTVTDEDGVFVLSNVSIGRHTLYVSYMGYGTAIIKELLVGSAKETYLEITLVEKPMELDEVVIRPKINKAEPLNEMATLGAQTFSIEEAGRFAGGMDDPARLASAYAGVATPAANNNGISIHGNAPGLLQWRLEGIEIPNPNHFADTDVLGGGFLSGLSSNVLGNFDFFIGAFPAEYNNAISGVFDMRLRNGNNRKYQHTFQLGVLGIDFASEGPVSKKQHSSYIINYRYSTTSLIEKIRGKENMGGTLDYQDLNFKFHFPTRKVGTFSLWGIGLIDKVIPILEDPSDWEYLDEGILTGAKQKSGAMGLSHRYLFGNYKTSLHTTIAGTILNSHVDEETCDFSENRSPRTDMTANTTNLVFTSYVNHKFSSRHTNKSGLTLTNINYDMNLDFTPVFGNSLENYMNTEGNTDLISVYSNSKINIGNSFILTAGFNAQYLALNRRATLEPRIGLKWQATPKNSFAIAYGLHSRMEKPDVYFVKDEHGNQPNRKLNFTKNHHLMLSYVYRISEDMNLKIEPYYQYLFDVPVTENGSYSILNRRDFYITEILVSKGLGRNYGVDFTFEKYFTKGIYYMVTASLFKSEYRGGDKVWYNTRYDRKFILNGLIGKEWMFGNDILGVNLKMSVLGGQRYTPVDDAATLAHPDKEVQYDETRMYSKQFSLLYIGDFSISYKMNRRRVAHEFAVKSVNATGQKEYNGHRYNVKTGEIEPYNTVTSMFNVSYRIEF
ncbi:MAG: carboxypeptidase-like regulatory domain-containing protein [Tannerella sp.]|nr:carboxypeptidase-like regulatory domain-containing protein [Tannerella sp.]